MSKRVPEYGEDIRDVEQDSHEVDVECDILETTGLGPCIGVAVAYRGRLSLAHYPNGASNDFGGYFNELEILIPSPERASIRPVVAGGLQEYALKNVLADRAYVLNKLTILGFGAPHVRWCTPQEDCHELELDAVAREILVTSQPIGSVEKFSF